MTCETVKFTARRFPFSPRARGRKRKTFSQINEYYEGWTDEGYTMRMDGVFRKKSKCNVKDYKIYSKYL